MAAPARGQTGVTVVNVANGGRVARASKPIPTSARPRASEEITSDASRLTRFLAELDAKIDDLARLTAANVFGTGVLVRNITMTGAAATLVEHRLRRAMTGWTLTRIVVTGATMPRICERALPTGRNSDQWLNLDADQPCTVDVLVF